VADDADADDFEALAVALSKEELPAAPVLGASVGFVADAEADADVADDDGEEP